MMADICVRKPSSLLNAISVWRLQPIRIFPQSVQITCLKHRMKTKAHYLVNDFFFFFWIRNTKVCFKKLTRKSYLGEKINNLNKEVLFQGQ